MLITDSESLAAFVRALEGVPYVAVDTEFVRDESYYPRLCLIQLAHGDQVAAIDTLVEGIDLRPLSRLLRDPSVVKVFHAAPQDLEIFLHATGSLPAPIFDTQVAAGVCGHGEQPGYSRLVGSMLDIELDKASQVTDWTRRPLTGRQLRYALSDVTHLCVLYERLSAELERSGRGEWIAEEMAALMDPTRYRTEPAEAYERIKVRRPTSKTLGVLRALAAWREAAAMDRDRPRRWVVRDEALLEMAERLPDSAEELAHVRGLSDSVAHGADGAAMLAAMRAALALPESEWPVVAPRVSPAETSDALVALLQALLRVRCEEHSVAMRLVATRRDLEALAWRSDHSVPAVHGWRRELFGADALALLEGRVALTWQAGEVVAVSVSPTDPGVPPERP